MDLRSVVKMIRGKKGTKVRLDVLNPSWILFSEGFRQGRVHSGLERAFDLKEDELEKKAETALWKLLDQAVTSGRATPYPR